MVVARLFWPGCQGAAPPLLLNLALCWRHHLRPWLGGSTLHASWPLGADHLFRGAMNDNTRYDGIILR